nr:hypothetical protein [Lachnospiraceae bacterium]
SIAKWIFLQLSPVTYRESLQFAGYFALNTVFLLPLHVFLHKLPPLKNRFLSCAAGIFFFLVLIMLPGVFDGFAFYGTPADVTMALVYGALLLAIWDREGHEKAFYYGRIALYVSILMLTKSVGVEWAVFALVFYLMTAKREKQILISVIAGGGFFACWPVFCLIRRRVAKLTGAGVKMVTSGYSVPDDAGTRLGYFVDGAFTMPMHQDHNLTFDLPMAAALVVIFALVIIMAHKKLINRQEMKKLILFLLVTAIIAFGIIFAAHISIFRTEDQYLDAYAMAVSIARYGCPFTLGSAMLLTGIAFERAGKAGNMCTSVIVFAASAAAILITADYTGMYRYLYGYRDSLDNDQAVIDEMIGDDGRQILEAVSEKGYWGRRVLVFRDGTVNHRVHDTYISKAASPVALVYDDLVIPDDTFQTISDKIEASHAGYVLAENPESEAGALFEAFMDEGVTYTAGRVYNVLYTPQGVRLSERDQTDGQ